MKLKILKIGISLMAFMILLTGCYPSGEQQLSSDSGKISEAVDEIISENEHLSIENTLPQNPTDKVSKINVKVMEWDTDKLNEIFLCERTGLEHTEYPSDDFPDIMYHVYIDNSNNDNYWLIHEPGRLTSEKREKTYGYGTLATSVSLYNFGDFFDDNTLEFFTKEDATKRSEELLKELGITNYSAPQVYAITADKANKFLSENYPEDNYKKWTVENEIYILEFPIEYEGIPVTNHSPSSREMGGHGAFFVGGGITVIVTKDEIFSLRCFQLFSPDYEVGDTVTISCNAQNAMKIAAEYYDGMVLGDSDIEILDCKLVYVPYEQDKQNPESFTLIPMWEIAASIDRHNSDPMGLSDYLFIDASTGNIIIW